MVVSLSILARGNCSLTSEFNVFCDPEAAHVILKSFTCPITMVTWNVCLESYLTWVNAISDENRSYHSYINNYLLQEWYQQKVLASNSVKANFIGRLFAKRNEWFKQIPAVFKGFMACDLLTIACLVDPEIILDKVKHYATVELNGLTTRGQLVVDWREFTNMPANVEFITKIDLKRLESLYESCLLR